MGKWMFAFAVVGVVGFFAESAQAQEVITTAPKVVASTQTVTPTTRVGLLGRVRERRGMTVVNQSTTTPSVAITPASTVTQAQATTQPANTMAATTQPVETRQGLLARLRSRR